MAWRSSPENAQFCFTQFEYGNALVGSLYAVTLGTDTSCSLVRKFARDDGFGNHISWSPDGKILAGKWPSVPTSFHDSRLGISFDSGNSVMSTDVPISSKPIWISSNTLYTRGTTRASEDKRVYRVHIANKEVTVETVRYAKEKIRPVGCLKGKLLYQSDGGLYLDEQLLYQSEEGLKFVFSDQSHAAFQEHKNNAVVVIDSNGTEVHKRNMDKNHFLIGFSVKRKEVYLLDLSDSKSMLRYNFEEDSEPASFFDVSKL